MQTLKQFHREQELKYVLTVLKAVNYNRKDSLKILKCSERQLRMVLKRFEQEQPYEYYHEYIRQVEIHNPTIARMLALSPKISESMKQVKRRTKCGETFHPNSFFNKDDIA